jgi:hypothetical protein
MASERPTNRAWWMAVTLLLGGCMTKPPHLVEADGTYCYRIGKSSRRTVTCTTAPVPLASVELDAKEFRTTPGAITAFVVRNRWGDARNRVTVTLDGGSPVQTIPQSLVRVRMLPGEHQVTFEWEGQRGVKTVTAGAGEVIFIELEGSVWSWGSTYRWADTKTEAARERAEGSKLIADLDLRR